jgi:2,3-bisphosphoglycerate-dependent phosphoglycerate mutase
VAVELCAGSVLWEVGSADFLHAFFSTVAARLEPAGWGSRFPATMRTLYAGRVAGEEAARAVAELDQIREELRAFPPADVVWSYEDRSQRPPWGDDIAPEITSLGDYFVTSDGRDLFAVLGEALAHSARSGDELTIG